MANTATITPFVDNPETSWNQQFADTALRLRPSLCSWLCRPQRLVNFEKDSDAYFGLKPVQSYSTDQLLSLEWGQGDEFVLDFGIHLVGSVSFQLIGTAVNDAPCRLRLTFGESPIDVTENMENVKTWISTSWLPDEVINVDYLPDKVDLKRRHSFRYLRIQVVDTSPKFKVKFSDVSCQAVSAIGQGTEIEDITFSDPILQAINDVAVFTLRDCMQTVFEDGPRRDRRLWIGDLRLQALTNYYTFKDFDLVKRCIYMFAAVARGDGSVPACVFEHSDLTPSTDYLVTYDALLATTISEYVEASGDVVSGRELWPTIQGCLKRALAHVDPTSHTFDSSRSAKVKFLDWAKGLETSAGSHGLLLYTLKSVNKLAKILAITPLPYTETIKNMTDGASHFLSQEGDLIVSGPGKQISLASASWLALSGAYPQETARTTLLNAMAHPQAIQPLTPYLWHYVCEALIEVGCLEESLDLLKSYWGGMIEAGADTFWECFDKNNPRASPYGDVRNNSFCHAWSCTPAYLLRGKLKEHVDARSHGVIKMEDLDARWIQRTCN